MALAHRTKCVSQRSGLGSYCHNVQPLRARIVARAEAPPTSSKVAAAPVTDETWEKEVSKMLIYPDLSAVARTVLWQSLQRAPLAMQLLQTGCSHTP